mgnify:CR=1 FL=1
MKIVALALETLLYLKEHHFIELDESSIVEGLFEAKWAGRFEIISEKPLIILDGLIIEKVLMNSIVLHVNYII